MRSKLLFITIMLCPVISVLAQDAQDSKNAISRGSVFKFQVGYGIPLVRTKLGVNSIDQLNNFHKSAVFGSFGSGLQIEAGYVHSLSEIISYQVDFTYLIGKQYNVSTTTIDYTGTSFNNGSINSRFFEISPLIKLILKGNSVRPYGAVGPIVGFGELISKTFISSTGSFNTQPGTKETEEQYKGSVAVGTKLVLGVEFVQHKVIYYLQMSLINMNYLPSKSEYTKYRVNNIDKLSTLTTSQRETVYSSSINTDPVTWNSDPKQPSQELYITFPLNSLALSAGVGFKL